MRRISTHPFPQWHCYQGESNDCGPVSATIVLNTLMGEDVADPDTLSKELLLREGLHLPGRIPRWATFPWGLVRLFRQRGLQARWRLLVKEAQLHENLRRGVATIVVVGEPFRFEGGRWRGWAHYEVLYGWEEGQWLLVDPASRTPVISQSAEAFIRQWRNLGRQVIEVWPA